MRISRTVIFGAVILLAAAVISIVASQPAKRPVVMLPEFTDLSASPLTVPLEEPKPRFTSIDVGNLALFKLMPDGTLDDVVDSFDNPVILAICHMVRRLEPGMP